MDLSHYKAPQYVKDAYQEDLKRLCLRDGSEMKLEQEGPNWLTVIRREGYRRIADRQVNYQGIMVLPLFFGDTYKIIKGELEISSGTVSESIAENPGTWVRAKENDLHSKLHGAVGCLYLKDKPNIIRRVSLGDFLGRDKKYTSVPETMIVGACEVRLIKAAYPNLFSGIFHQDDIVRAGKKERLQLLDVIDKHAHLKEVSLMMEKLGKRRNLISMESLREICEKINKIEEA